MMHFVSAGILVRAALCVALSSTLFVRCVASASAQLIVAHRGASGEAPENTGAAFKLAWRQGADAIEGDFYLSRDGEIVCMHDRTTERTAGVNLTVAEATLAELQQLDVGAWKSPRFAGEKILTLTQVLELVPTDKKIFIEIKCGPEIVPALERTLSRLDVPPEQAVVISFQDDVIAAVKKRLPKYQAYWLVGFKQNEQTGAWGPGVDRVVATASRIGADGVDLQATPEMLDAPFVARCRDAGLGVHTWTVDDPARARQLQALGVDSITTNLPAKLRRALELETVSTETSLSVGTPTR